MCLSFSFLTDVGRFCSSVDETQIWSNLSGRRVPMAVLLCLAVAVRSAFGTGVSTVVFKDNYYSSIIKQSSLSLLAPLQNDSCYQSWPDLRRVCQTPLCVLGVR